MLATLRGPIIVPIVPLRGPIKWQLTKCRHFVHFRSKYLLNKDNVSNSITLKLHRNEKFLKWHKICTSDSIDKNFRENLFFVNKV